MKSGLIPYGGSWAWEGSDAGRVPGGLGFQVGEQPNPGLMVALILLGLVSAVLAAMQQRSSQPQPAAAALGTALVLYGHFADGPYGDAWFWARRSAVHPARRARCGRRPGHRRGRTERDRTTLTAA